MCDNILELLPYMYAIYTMQEMSADPDYDITANRTWWESFTHWITTSLLWVDSLDNNVKMLAGVALFALAVALTIATGGASAATMVGALCFSMLLTTALGGVVGGISAAIGGGNFAEGMLDGASDAILWGGLSAFAGVAMQMLQKTTAAVLLNGSQGISGGRILKTELELESYKLDPRSIELAKEGNPTFGTFRKRVWKYEARFRPELYKGQLSRMVDGLAPQVGGYSMHLHHVVGRKIDLYNVIKVTRQQHIAIHKAIGYHYNAMWTLGNILKFL